MIYKDTLDFLRDLVMNNNRDWFHSQKERYETAKKNILDITTVLTSEIGKFDPSIKSFDPRKGMFRIARDLRFSPNKEPYKHNFGSCINTQGKNICSCSTYYLNIEPDFCFASAGVYMPVKDYLQDIRYNIYNNFDAFSEIVNEKSFFKLTGGLAKDADCLKRVPDCFDKKHPAAEFMKLKSYYAYATIGEDILTDEKKCIPELVRIFKILQPLNTFLNESFQSNE